MIPIGQLLRVLNQEIESLGNAPSAEFINNKVKMKRFIDCIHPVNNRVADDPNYSSTNNERPEPPEPVFGIMRTENRINHRRLSIEQKSMLSAAVLDLPLDVPGINMQTGIPHASSISNFLRINNTTIKEMMEPNNEDTHKRTLGQKLFQIWDSSFTLRVVGTRKRILEEQEFQERYNHWVIHPCSRFRLFWDVIMFIVLAINVLLVPVAIAFISNTITPQWISFSVISDIFFICDIFFNFRTGIISNENVVILELNKIRLIYLKSWFILDLITVLPLDYASMIASYLLSDSSSTLATMFLKANRLVKLASLLKLLRAIRFLRYLSKWEGYIAVTKSTIRVCNLLLTMLIITHMSGCMQFLIPYIQGFPYNSWVTINRLKDEPVFVQYSWSIFKSISHMICIGYGRFPPQNTMEVWMTIISMLTGASFYAMLIGHISTLVYSVDSASRQFEERIKQVEEYMRYRRLPQHLKTQVHEYYSHKYHGQLFDEQSILGELSHSLTERIVTHNCRNLIQIVPFFQDMSEAFINCVITRLKFEVFLPGDCIIRQGLFGTKMYFIQQGRVDILLPNGKVATSLSDGAYFGETCLLMKSRRIGSVMAVSMCDLYALSNDDFQHCLDEFPNMRIKLEGVASDRLAMISSSRDQINREISEKDELPRTDSPICMLERDSSICMLERDSPKCMLNKGDTLQSTASSSAMFKHRSSSMLEAGHPIFIPGQPVLSESSTFSSEQDFNPYPSNNV